MCAKAGNDTTAFTCAYTQGTAAEMAANTRIGTVETTSAWTGVKDFNSVMAISATTPV